MKDLYLIKRKKEDNFYTELQQKTLERIGELSGKVWTDYNVHDPGITISDYLNYALYDLNYRLQFPFENYLFQSEHDKSYPEKGLFPKNTLFTEQYNDKEVLRKSIVTEEDFEELIVKNNSDKLNKFTLRLNKKTLLYDFFLVAKKELITDEEKLNLEDSVTSTFHQYRNLCENIGDIYYDWNQLEKKELYNQRRFFKKSSYEFPEFVDKPTNKEQFTKPFSSDYQTIQYDFPENYGIGERGIPNSENEDYTAKVLQLKAYLLLFDKLMADQLSQAKNVSDLFELSEKLPQNRLPDVHIIEGDKIVDLEKKEIVVDQLQADSFNNLQKFRYLNMLDTMYGENTRTLFGKNDLPVLNQKRAKLLQSLPKLNEFRFRSFNINESNSIPIVQFILDEIIRARFNTHEFFSVQIRIISDDLFFDRYRFLLGTSLHQLNEQAELEDLPEMKVTYDEESSFALLRLHLNLIWHGIIPESILNYGTIASNYKIVAVSDEFLLLFFHPEKKVIINMSLFSSDKEKLVEITHLFIAYLYQIKANGHQQSFYFLEHILLNSGPSDSNLLSIIIPEKLKGMELEEIIRDRLPAHLQIILYYVPIDAMANFHSIYFGWRKSLAEKSNNEITYYSDAMNFFLKHVEKSAKHI